MSYKINYFRIKECKISHGTNEIYPIHSFGDRVSAFGDFVCFDKKRIWLLQLYFL